MSSLNSWGGTERLKNLLRGRKKVLIKPNLCGRRKDGKGTQTSPEVLAAVIGIIKEISPHAKIVVANLDQFSRMSRKYSETASMKKY